MRDKERFSRTDLESQRFKRDIFDKVLELQSNRKELEDRADELRRERALQAECIRELKFQNEDSAVQTHEDKMEELGRELTNVQKEIEAVEGEILAILSEISVENRKDTL